MAKLQFSLIACRQDLRSFQEIFFDSTSSQTRSNTLLPLSWDIFVSLAEILPGPGSLCFTLAGVSSFIAALILLGLEKALSEVGMLAQ